MRSTARFSRAAVAAGIVATLLVAATPAVAQQTRPGEQRQTVYGERYSVEMATTWWTPSVYGVVQSDAIDAIGSSISFTDDLGYESSRFTDLRFVIRPAKKHRIRIQYTPGRDAQPRRHVPGRGVSRERADRVDVRLARVAHGL
jgi:hypothetical protein